MSTEGTAPPARTRTLEDDPRGDGSVRQPCLFLVLDSEHPLAPTFRYSLLATAVCKIGRGDPRATRSAWEDGKLVLDIRRNDAWMSTSHAVIARDNDRWIIQDDGSKNGTRVKGERIAGPTALHDGDVIEIGRAFFVFRLALPVWPDDPQQVASDRLMPPRPRWATLLPQLAHAFSKLASIAASKSSVILRGEPGTGKEIAARGVHDLSGRHGPFIAVNCGAIPSNLVEAELFGHRRGAFSGAIDDRPGLIRASDGGTLMLDEIAELPVEAQVSLLRALQEQEVRPVGGTEAVPVDLRIVAATNRDLESAIAQGRFRADLHARLVGYTMTIPPLRERPEDLGLIISAILSKCAPGRTNVSISAGAARVLMRYTWPQNIRELEKVIESALALATDGAITSAELPETITQIAETVVPPRPRSITDMNDHERRDLLVSLLQQHGGNVTHVARAVGKERTQIRRWLERYGINAGDFDRSEP